MGFWNTLTFDKLKDGLAKTRTGLVEEIGRLMTSRTVIDATILDGIEKILITADIGTETAAATIDGLRARVKTERYSEPADIYRLLKEELRNQLGGPEATDDYGTVLPARPYVVMVVGINGAGKTTTIGKLAHNYVRAGKRVFIGAADTFRAAANEQMEIWAQRAGAEVIRQQRGADPAAVAFDAVRSAVANAADVVIIDTAGRLHTNVNLMEELRKIKRVLQKQDKAFPHEVLLVIDATTGQNGLQQARQFGAAVGLTGIVLTKIDGTAKGGIVFAVTRAMNVPVKFVGVGERIDDLQPFDPNEFVNALFGT